LEKQLGANIQFKFVPGGGSTKGANLYASRAKPNGLELIGTSGVTRLPFEVDRNIPAVPC
jgi:tripartite-type tricarboxylate transporter receptor subunit TctC